MLLIITSTLLLIIRPLHRLLIILLTMLLSRCLLLYRYTWISIARRSPLCRILLSQEVLMEAQAMVTVEMLITLSLLREQKCFINLCLSLLRIFRNKLMITETETVIVNWNCIYHRRVSMLSCTILLVDIMSKDNLPPIALGSMFIFAIRFGIVQVAILLTINWINVRIIYLKILQMLLCKILLYIWMMKRVLMVRGNSLLIILLNLLKKIMLTIEVLELIICNLTAIRALLRRTLLSKSLLHHLTNR